MILPLLFVLLPYGHVHMVSTAAEAPSTPALLIAPAIVLSPLLLLSPHHLLYAMVVEYRPDIKGKGEIGRFLGGTVIVVGVAAGGGLSHSIMCV